MTFDLIYANVQLPMAAVCSQCGHPYPHAGFPHRCPLCGGVYDLVPGERSSELPRSTISLGEGNTPLLPLPWGSGGVFVKCEHNNPTGSYKDRGTARLVSALIEQGVKTVVEDSSGNAGASLAAYAARAGIHARIYAPASASGPKRAQIIRYGAELVPVEGPRMNAAHAVLEDVGTACVYASHAYQPHWLAGVASMALEIAAGIEGVGTVVAPVGQGGLLLGLYHGFRAAAANGVAAGIPALVGVQAQRCAPVWRQYAVQKPPGDWGSSIAEGICIAEPVRGEAVLEAVRQTGGEILAVEEDDILAGVQALAREGLDVEPTSGVVFAALRQLESPRKPVVLILTGSGLKQPADQRAE
ncbi:MAG: pyridoxal-phosphate dependent enzyme [Anaerolineales bacterium]|nr:pyridoxal-phosphate dependent enzyme [Anaerolineales bacterium]